MTKPRICRTAVAGLVVVSVGLMPLLSNGAPVLVDLDGLRAGGDDWIVVGRENGPGDRETIKLFQDKWHMYFLHWRPLTPASSALTAAYAEHLLLNFWGDDMPFELLGGAQETEVAGHPARLVDGTIYDNRIRTRFLIWNCPETGRQLVADCNINRARGTSEAMLERQYEITDTLSCHGQEPAQTHPSWSVVRFDQYRISFAIPPTWRASVFSAREWFPEGPTMTNGTLWTLPADSQKFIYLTRTTADGSLSASEIKQQIRRAEGVDYLLDERTTATLESIVIHGVEHKKTALALPLEVTFLVLSQEQQSREVFRSRAIAWQADGSTYLLIAGVVAIDQVWHRPTDLTPTDEEVDDFVMGVLKHVLGAPDITEAETQP